MSRIRTLIALDREEMSETERILFLNDVKKITDEYFECDCEPSLEITRSEDGFIVCLLFTARRVKALKEVR